MSKLKVGILFGGQSEEHEVSQMSAKSIIKNIDMNKYEIYLIGITKSGEWYLYEGNPEDIETKDWEKSSIPVILGASTKYKGFFAFKDGGNEFYPIDIVFPVLHGPKGEDGTIQGLLELLSIPYVGANVLSSSLCMDKVFTKRIFKESGLPTADFISVYRNEINNIEEVKDKLTKENIGYPCFVKPANLGSSVGITKVHSEDELLVALNLAAKYDRKIIIEKGINAREIECSVLGNNDPQASIPGEIVPSNEFYDYNAKYFDDGKSILFIPAPIPDVKINEVKELSLKAYKALDLNGMARVDFLMDKDTGELYLNEINTIPGFTKISMYPKLWEASGKPYSVLIDELINLAIEMYEEKRTKI